MSSFAPPPHAPPARTRRALLGDLARLTGTAALAGPLWACAPTAPAAAPPRVYRVGIGSVPDGGAIVPLFWARLEELGYVEGRNLVRIDRSPNGGQPYDATAAELARQEADVVIVGNNPALRAVIAAMPSTPIVLMNHVGDPPPEAVQSVARPGGNVTGMLGAGGEVFQKRLQLLIEVAPATSKVAVLGPLPPNQAPPFQEAAASFGIPSVEESIQAREDLEPAFEHAVSAGADALFVPVAVPTAINRDLVIRLAAAYRLPAIYPDEESVQAGGLMAYAARVGPIAGRAADFVDRILHGTRPADLPIERPSLYDLVVNTSAARALDLALPSEFLAQITRTVD